MAKDKTYWTRVKEHAKALKGDGCTSSPDFWFHRCCNEHDIAYRTGKTVDGVEVTRAEADNQLFVCMKKRNKDPLISKWILPALYWSAVRLFGRGAWKRDEAMGDKKN